jgi:predicted negative regulator of RcsB-dependent stress response
VARISRKELKKDEFRESFAHGAEAVSLHKQGFSIALTVAVIIAVGVLGWRYYSQRETAEASTLLADAMKTFDARVRTPETPTQPGEITYPDDKDKYTDAAAKLGAIASHYGRTRPGQQALYFDALCQIHLNNNDVAERNLVSLADSGGPDLAALADYQLASIYASTGKTDQAVKLYQQLIAKPDVLVPKPIAMLALADAYSHSNPAEAVKELNQIKTEFPNSPAADEANKRLSISAGQS